MSLPFHPEAERRYILYADSLKDIAPALDVSISTTAGPDGRERIMGANDLLPIAYLQRALLHAKAVARITRVVGGAFAGYGTGFLISPDLFVTNHHVLADAVQAAHCIVEFNYEINLDHQRRVTEQYQLRPDRLFLTSPKDELDYTIVAIDRVSVSGYPNDSFGFIPLRKTPPGVTEQQCVTIIQHPEGDYKKIALRDNYIVGESEGFVLYRTDSKSGSSGSPVFNDHLELVALHHAGIAAKNEQGQYLTVDGEVWKSWMGESRIKWVGNEGILISRIVKSLDEKLPDMTQDQQQLLKAALLSEL